MSVSRTDFQIDSVLHGLKVNSAAQLMDVLEAEIANQAAIPVAAIKNAAQKMKTSSFCPLGDGVAVPNATVKFLQRPLAILCVLDKPIECDSPDNKSVNVVCVLLSPEDYGPMHLQRLSRFSRLFKDKKLCNKMRDAHDADVIRALVNSPDGWMIAA